MSPQAVVVDHDVDGPAGQAYRLYRAAFSRTPDLQGLGYHIAAMQSGQSLQDISGNFLRSPEFEQRYGTLDTAAFVTQLYANVLGRAPDAGGLAFHSGNLDSGRLTRAQVLIGFSESLENKQLTAAEIAGGILYIPAGGSGLSSNQRLFEELTLAANGGLYALWIRRWVSLAWDAPKLMAAGFNKLEIPSSPAGHDEGVERSYTPSADLWSGIPLSGPRDDWNPIVGAPILVGGQIDFLPTASRARYRYVGDDIVAEQLTLGGTPIRNRYNSIQKVQLQGRFIDSPQEFRDYYAPLEPYMDGSRSFAEGSAFYKRSAHRVEDVLVLNDADDNPATDPQSASPAFLGTIEQYAANAPYSLELARGAVRTVAGARCWINHTSRAPNAPSWGANPVLPYAYEPSFGAVCEVAGKVYTGTLQPDGSQLGVAFPVSMSGPSWVNYERQPFNMRLNKTALDSLRAMLR